MTKTGLTFIAQNVYYLGLSFVTCPAYKHRNITRRYIYPTKNCENRKHSLISKNLNNGMNLNQLLKILIVWQGVKKKDARF